MFHIFLYNYMYIYLYLYILYLTEINVLKKLVKKHPQISSPPPASIVWSPYPTGISKNWLRKLNFFEERSTWYNTKNLWNFFWHPHHPKHLKSQLTKLFHIQVFILNSIWKSTMYKSLTWLPNSLQESVWECTRRRNWKENIWSLC